MDDPPSHSDDVLERMRQESQAAHVGQQPFALGTYPLQQPRERKVAHVLSASWTFAAIGKMLSSRAISNTPRTRAFNPARMSLPL